MAFFVGEPVNVIRNGTNEGYRAHYAASRGMWVDPVPGGPGGPLMAVSRRWEDQCRHGQRAECKRVEPYPEDNQML